MSNPAMYVCLTVHIATLNMVEEMSRESCPSSCDIAELDAHLRSSRQPVCWFDELLQQQDGPLIDRFYRQMQRCLLLVGHAHVHQSLPKGQPDEVDKAPGPMDPMIPIMHCTWCIVQEAILALAPIDNVDRMDAACLDGEDHAHKA